MKIRATTHDDIAPLQRVLDGTGLFPAEMLPEMISGALDSRDIWLTVETEGAAVGFCYAAAEDLADGTWNMRAIAVLPAQQGGGHGRALVHHLEEMLKQAGQRIIIVDTSGTDEFAQTRRFYQQNGYHEEARIRDFWAAGDDKIVFWKSLT